MVTGREKSEFGSPIPIRPDAANDACHLIFHLLSQLDLESPASLRHHEYDSWAAVALPQSLQRAIAGFSEELNASVASEKAWSKVHVAGCLYDDLDAIERDVAVSECGAQARRVLERSAPGTLGLLRRAIASLSEAFGDFHESEVAPAVEAARAEVAPWLLMAETLLPGLRERRIELVWSLGPRGRGFSNRIYVGSPAAWHELAPQVPCVLALHEHCVALTKGTLRSSTRESSRAVRGSAHYAEEWGALIRLASVMVQAPVELEATHCAWLASVHLQPLVLWAQRRGAIDIATATLLQEEPLRRAEVMASL